MSDPKTLLPELLPAPTAQPPSPPRARVAERARVLLERFRSLGPVAGAAVLSVHCGYGVVDPLPPPPKQCSALRDPFAPITASVAFNWVTGAARPPVVITLTSMDAVGFLLGEVRVTGGTLVTAEKTAGYPPPAATQIKVTVAPDTETSILLVDVDLGCDGATATKHYRVPYHVPQFGNDQPTIEEIR